MCLYFLCNLLVYTRVAQSIDLSKPYLLLWMDGNNHPSSAIHNKVQTLGEYLYTEHITRLHSMMWVYLCIPIHAFIVHVVHVHIAMYTTLSACFLCFFYNPYNMSLFKIFHLLVSSLFYLVPAKCIIPYQKWPL